MIYLFLAAWGDDYVSMGTTLLIPSLLRQENLPALVKQYNLSLHIYCPASSEGVFRAAINDLDLKLNFYDVENVSNFNKNEHKYNKMTLCHKHFMRSIPLGSYAVFLHPDFFLSGNLMQTLKQEVFSKGLNAYFCHVLRTSKKIIPELFQSMQNHTNLDTYSLAKLSLQNQLPSCLLYDVSCPLSSTWPLELTSMRRGTKFVLSKGLHPLVILKSIEVDFISFDNDLFDRMHALSDHSKIGFERDNRRFMISEMNKPSMKIGSVLKKKSSAIYIASIFSTYMTESIRRRFFSIHITYFSSPQDIPQYLPFQLLWLKLSILFWQSIFRVFKSLPQKIIKKHIGEVVPHTIFE
jgi:hypothetical protein